LILNLKTSVGTGKEGRPHMDMDPLIQEEKTTILIEYHGNYQTIPRYQKVRIFVIGATILHVATLTIYTVELGQIIIMIEPTEIHLIKALMKNYVKEKYG